MPYLLMIVIIIFIAGKTTSVSYDSFYRIKDESSRVAVDALNQIEDIELAIVRRQNDFFDTDWVCETDPCNGVYNRVVVDSGYVGTTTWESELIPDYLFQPHFPSGWVSSMTELDNSLFLCLDVTLNEFYRDVISQMHRYEHQGILAVGSECNPAAPFTQTDIEAYQGTNLFVTRHLVHLN